MSLGDALGLALLLPWAGGVALLLAPAGDGRRAGWLALLCATASFLGLGIIATKVGASPSFVFDWPWVPSCGLSLSLMIDGLSLFFGLVVSGMGVLVVFYAIFYMGDHGSERRRFFASLLFFMGAMLGTVFSNNLLLLFIFWELTGVASYTLIGFDHGREESRRAARMALVVTALTGLVMLLGLVMLRQVTGTFDLATILRAPLPSTHKDWLDAAMILVLVGALGKSAQIPFHFWLPNAMAAPTPVSAYLHSATMVKLGVFLCARLYPVFQGREYWAVFLGVPAFATMLFGALLAFRSTDLKAILAYSTVSQLGFLVGYYALGPDAGVDYDYLHILNHVFYKGSLFMVAGIVAHAAGSRDIRELGGLRHRLPATAIACGIACAAMAGLPLTTGFLSKEFMLKEIFQSYPDHAGLGWYAAACVGLTTLLKVAFAGRIFFKIFYGQEPPDLASRYHAPSPFMAAPACLLSGAALVFGLWPTPAGEWLRSLSVSGLHSGTAEQFAVWHGFTPELATSAAMVAGGAALAIYCERKNWCWDGIPAWSRAERLFESAMDALAAFAKFFERATLGDRPAMALPVVVIFIASCVGAYAWKQTDDGAFTPLLLFLDYSAAASPLRIMVGALMLCSLGCVLFVRSWGGQLIALGASGFLLSVYFVLYRAPDLALTQILVEGITLVAVVLLLGRFAGHPATAPAKRHDDGVMEAARIAAALAAAFGVGVACVVVTGLPHPNPIGRFYLDHTESLAKGANAVNTVLIDFRGYDTLGEIAVLFAAMLGCIGLLMRYKRKPSETGHAIGQKPRDQESA